MESVINKKARFNYTLSDKYVAGIVLEGWEVKPILARQVNLDVSFITIQDGEVFLINALVSPSETSDRFNKPSTDRKRKLLLNKREIMQLIGKVQKSGFTLVPTKIFTMKNKIKVEIALAKGKKDHDKRETIKNRDSVRETSRILKKSTKSS